MNVMPAATQGSSFSLQLLLFLSFYLYTHIHIFPFFFIFYMRTDITILISFLAIATRTALNPAGGIKNSSGRSLLHQPGSLHSLTNAFHKNSILLAFFDIRMQIFCLKSSCGSPPLADMEALYWQGKYVLLLMILKYHWCQACHTSWTHSSCFNNNGERGWSFFLISITPG